MENIWIEVSFDECPMDNVIAHNMEEAESLIKSIETNGFENYNEEVKEEWLEMGFGNNPKVTAKLTK